MASPPLGPLAPCGVSLVVCPKLRCGNLGHLGTHGPQDLPLGGLGKSSGLLIDDLELGSTRSLNEVKGVSPLGDEIWKRLLLLGVAWDLFPAPSGLKLFHISFGDGFSFIRWIRFVSI